MGYVMIQFASGDHVTTYNECTVRDHREGQALGKLLSVDVNAERIVFAFESGCTATVDIRDDAWVGPEALSWYEGGQIYVWRD